MVVATNYTDPHPSGRRRSRAVLQVAVIEQIGLVECHSTVREGEEGDQGKTNPIVLFSASYIPPLPPPPPLSSPHSPSLRPQQPVASSSPPLSLLRSFRVSPPPSEAGRSEARSGGLQYPSRDAARSGAPSTILARIDKRSWYDQPIVLATVLTDAPPAPSHQEQETDKVPYPGYSAYLVRTTVAGASVVPPPEGTALIRGSPSLSSRHRHRNRLNDSHRASSSAIFIGDFDGKERGIIEDIDSVEEGTIED
ncbi:hypothetical protein PRIPAC_72935 [Pristionchus pacificus]|uniref:Uncharacterized protein n=1 Tax=Pristionchus pacificus TaxID=54126 RepID=A0A2A6CRH1_PRIPA|nr:hypothetical protein PRIPAC_72935 [Pristionchus pacificus]|eukprot:PDM80812.1 hypothetical protein PRIPAC_35815 [Pristionchus pacificus]